MPRRRDAVLKAKCGIQNTSGFIVFRHKIPGLNEFHIKIRGI
jgi:hypothetical protein